MNAPNSFTPTLWEPEAYLTVMGFCVVVLVLCVSLILMFRGMR